VRLSRELAAPEIALLGLLEVVFGVTWAWLGAGEQPGGSTLIGGALVLARWSATKRWRCAALPARPGAPLPAIRGRRRAACPAFSAVPPAIAA
jgi:hypothetical protein